MSIINKVTRKRTSTTEPPITGSNREIVQQEFFRNELQRIQTKLKTLCTQTTPEAVQNASAEASYWMNLDPTERQLTEELIHRAKNTLTEVEHAIMAQKSAS